MVTGVGRGSSAAVLVVMSMRAKRDPVECLVDEMPYTRFRLTRVSWGSSLIQARFRNKTEPDQRA